MNTVKLKAPEGATSINHPGGEITVEADGSVMVPAHVAEHLTAHGYVPWEEAEVIRKRRARNSATAEGGEEQA